MAAAAATKGRDAELLVIAHRGNTHGRLREYENRPEYFGVAFEGDVKYEASVDVWLRDGAFHFGSDAPDVEVKRDVVTEFPDMFWFVARDAAAYDALRKLPDARTVRLPAADSADTEATVDGGEQDGKRVVFAGGQLTDGCICYRPELSKRLPGFWKSFGVVTDFAELFKIYYNWYKDQARVKTEQLKVDEQIAAGRTDERRCLSLVASFDGWQRSDDGAFERMLADAAAVAPGQNVFAPADAVNVMHHTFFTVIGYEQFAAQYAYFQKYHKAYDQVISEELNSLLPYEVTFRGLLLTKRGVWMLGYPSKEVNVARGRLERRLQKKALVYMRSVNSLVYASVVRLNSAGVEAADLREFVGRYEDTYFGTLTVDRLTLAVASNRMQPAEVQPVKHWHAPQGNPLHQQTL